MKTNLTIELNPSEILKAVAFYLEETKKEMCEPYESIMYNFPKDWKGFKFELFNKSEEDKQEKIDKNSRSEHKPLRLIRVDENEAKGIE
jgi:hypothetical protein